MVCIFYLSFQENDIFEHAFANFVFSSLNIIAKMAQKIDTGSEKATRAFMCSLNVQMHFEATVFLCTLPNFLCF